MLVGESESIHFKSSRVKDIDQLFIKINMIISISTKQRENLKNIKARKFNVAERENTFMKQQSKTK